MHKVSCFILDVIKIDSSEFGFSPFESHRGWPTLRASRRELENSSTVRHSAFIDSYGEVFAQRCVY
jgi:hypothetical protein